MSILYKSTRFADTFTGNKETNVRVQLLSWDTLDTKAFVEYLADKNNHQVGDIFVCRKFVDRDMQKMKEFGLECEIDSSALLEEKGFCKHWTENGICNTGDGFLTELTHVNGDVVDMEAYAQAFVCRSKEIPFISVKYVTDIIGQNSVKHWEDKLADARQGLSNYFNVLKERI